jgi:pimeloyl-ACP methyl ester carboxylesterase
VTQGRSIGTGVAVEVAKRFLDIAGLILISPFTSIKAVAANINGIGHIANFLLDKDKNFCNIDKVEYIRCPTYCIHGTEDSLIDHKQSDQLKGMRG